MRWYHTLLTLLVGCSSGLPCLLGEDASSEATITDAGIVASEASSDANQADSAECNTTYCDNGTCCLGLECIMVHHQADASGLVCRLPDGGLVPADF